jgi:hypothetical protein
VLHPASPVTASADPLRAVVLKKVRRFISLKMFISFVFDGTLDEF